MAITGRYEDFLRKPGEERKFCRLILRHLGDRDSIDLRKAVSVESTINGLDFRVTDETTAEGHPCVCFWAKETKWVTFKQKIDTIKDMLIRLVIAIVVGLLSTIFLGFVLHCFSLRYGFKVNLIEFSIVCTMAVAFLFFFLTCLLSSSGDDIVAGP